MSIDYQFVKEQKSMLTPAVKHKIKSVTFSSKVIRLKFQYIFGYYGFLYSWRIKGHLLSNPEPTNAIMF